MDSQIIGDDINSLAGISKNLMELGEPIAATSDIAGLTAYCYLPPRGRRHLWEANSKELEF